MTKPVDSQCQGLPARDRRARQAVGRALILNVLQERPLRFSELAAAADGPADTILSARLKELETNGLVRRDVDPGPPVRVTYALTSCGRGFGEVAASIERWGRSLPRRA